MQIALRTFRERISPATRILFLLAAMALPATALADFTYTDGSFGLAITFPDGTGVMRVTSPAGESGTEIGQFTLPGGNTVGRLVVSDVPEGTAFADALKAIRSQLAEEAKVDDKQITAEKVQVKGNYKSAMLLHAWDSQHKLYNGVLAVQGPSDQIILLYAATIGSRADGLKVTRDLAAQFEVLLNAKDEQKNQEAIFRGSAMLLGIAVPVPKAEDLWSNQYLLIQGPEGPCGYIVISETPKDRSNKPGLNLQSEEWLFWPKNTAQYELQTAFATWDLRHDEWSCRTETVVDAPKTPGQPASPAKIVSFDQKTLRLANNLADVKDTHTYSQQILTEMTDPKNPGKTITRVVPCPRNFMPAAWRWILPRLLANKKPGSADSAADWSAVVTYSPLRRGLETQMFNRITYGQVLQVRQREGLYGETETWQFNTDGTLRQINTPGFIFVPTSKAEAEKLFASQIAAWRQKVNPQNNGKVTVK